VIIDEWQLPTTEAPSHGDARYFPLEVSDLAVDRSPGLDLYHRNGRFFVLYCDADAVFSAEARSDLVGNGVTQLFARLAGGGDAQTAEIERILGQPDDVVPAPVKAGLLYQSTLCSAALTFTAPRDPSTIERATQAAGLVVVGLARDRGSFGALFGFLNHSHSAYAHSVNVCAYAVIVGAMLGLPPAAMQDLALAAFLHDLGKARVPSSILDKPASLTSGEWRVVRQHPGWSVDLLARSGLRASVMGGIAQHHERLDGSGYPRALHSTDIGTLARLIALVDVYDALTSNRPYRQGFAPFDALQIMSRDVGPRLDRELFVALVYALGK
jgi:HD-GYP domain-containing protein (c-di-GMP phosphodiesterase class II)